jgi:hypothetical protein
MNQTLKPQTEREATSDAELFFRDNPIRLVTHHMRGVYKSDIRAALKVPYFYRELQAMFDADPDFGIEYEPFRKNKWVSITIAEKIVKRWIDNPFCRVEFVSV